VTAPAIVPDEAFQQPRTDRAARHTL